MAYREDLVISARRHLRAAEELHGNGAAGAQPGCKAVAGYLFGLSGELAVKAIMRDSGVERLPNDQRRNDPYYAHFPNLKSLLLDSAFGRRSGELRLIAENASLFHNWDTEMRYAPTADIQDKWIENWRTSAHELVGRMDMPL